MFFQRHDPQAALAEGGLFQRQLGHNQMEMARIHALTTGPSGIRHVRFRLSLPGINDGGDLRILAADVFAQLYQPAEPTATG
ncbi:MAG: hypothetical protein QF578_22350 [Alphaproteobacteria bacterium]|jgi:hypothetical protein|nr:hypothetical protein [Alphaproteobacteria bacterium]MDP6814213.1 hypothetical protein [Alphaproteobacteria bacterium]|tara:strand:- start:27 stop:272 length:246 start_codon:yes stop_codon:yes gene_type:complete